jgi:hypothetical protein
MKHPDRIDFAKLLGFDTVGDEISGCVDFQDDAIEAKLGAKVGGKGCLSPFELADATKAD